MVSNPLSVNDAGVLRSDFQLQQDSQRKSNGGLSRFEDETWSGHHLDNITFTRRRLPIDNAFSYDMVVNPR